MKFVKKKLSVRISGSTCPSLQCTHFISRPKVNIKIKSKLSFLGAFTCSDIMFLRYKCIS